MSTRARPAVGTLAGMDHPAPPRPVTKLGLWAGDPASSPGRGPLERAAAVASAAERAGFDSLWVTDEPVGPASGPVGGVSVRIRGSAEAYSLLGALATRTHSIRLGAMPTGGEARHPAVLAKIVTGVDVISHGRSVVALAPGPGDGGKGVARLAEALQVCRAVLDDEEPRFRGRFYRVEGAVNHPRPVQRGGVPLVVVVGTGRGLDAALGDIVRRYADAVVVEGGDDEVAQAAHAARVGATTGGGVEAPRVIWTVRASPSGRPEPAGRLSWWSEDQLAGELVHRLAAGADGCIVSVAGAGQLDAIARLGATLGGVMGSA